MTDTTEPTAGSRLLTGKAVPRLFSGLDISHARIPADLCDRGTYQPRRDFSEQQLQELADSIRQTGGNIQPVILRPKSAGRYEILAGERRVRAVMLAGLDFVSAIIGDFSDHQSHIITVVENLQRADLNPIEEAMGFQSLIESGLKQQDVADSVGKSRVFIANSVRLLKLDIVVKDLLRNNQLSQGHGKAIAGLKPKRKGQDTGLLERDLARKCARRGWSVRRLEAEVQKINNEAPVATLPRSKNANIRKLEELVTEKFGGVVAIRPSSKMPEAGFIHIPYINEKELRTILEKMNAWPDKDEWETET